MVSVESIFYALTLGCAFSHADLSFFFFTRLVLLARDHGTRSRPRCRRASWYVRTERETLSDERGRESRDEREEGNETHH